MKNFILFLFSFFCFSVSAQDSTESSNHGTVKIQKRGVLHSVIYDDVNFRLICRDIYGNINDTAVLSYELNVTIKGIAYSEAVAGATLSRLMQQRLSRMDGLTTLMFSKIKARDKNGRIITFPDFTEHTGRSIEKDDY